MPDVILLNELTDRINELNSDLESDINAINSNVTTVGSSLSSKIDALGTDLSASVNTVKTATATNNTASLTGTLSQKLSYIANTLIGKTNATGGTATAGTIMAKLNKLLKFHTSPFQKTSFSKKVSTTANTELQILTLNNIMLYGIFCTIGSSSDSYEITGYATINGVKVATGTVSTDGYVFDTNLVNDFSSAIGVGFTTPKLSNDTSPFTLAEPIFVETLTMSVLSTQTGNSRVWFSGDIYYKQL